MFRNGTFDFALKHVYDGYENKGMLMMTAGIWYQFSSQCIQNIDNTVYFRSKQNELIRFVLNFNDPKESVVLSCVEDFKLESQSEISVMSADGRLKRVKLENVDGPQAITTTVLKEIQLTNGQSSTTHWTTFCRLGKHTCVAGHDSSVSPYNTFLEVIAESNTDFTVLPIRATFTNNNSSCK